MLPKNEFLNIKNILSRLKIIPIAVFSDMESALKTAEVLLENSFDLLEITLRTEAAYQCIEAIVKRFPEMNLGCGSVLSSENLDRAVDRGAMFAVSPSLNPGILKYALSKNIVFIPGIATPTEFNLALDEGAGIIKIFPVTYLGGPGYIKSILAPFKLKEFSIVPTGGITNKNFSDYLMLPEVIACGLSYVVDSKVIQSGDFKELDKRIKEIKNILSSM